MAEGEFWQDTKRRCRQQRIETIVAGVIGGMIPGPAGRTAATRASVITEAFAWADAIMRESDRREDEAAP